MSEVAGFGWQELLIVLLVLLGILPQELIAFLIALLVFWG